MKKNTTKKMIPNDKVQKRKEANRIRSSNFRKNKETPEQADIRKKNESIRSAERRKRKFTLDNISKTLSFDLENEENFPYISKMVDDNDVINRAYHHLMKTKIGSDEYLTKDIREKIGLNMESTSTTKCSNLLLNESINQIYVSAVTDLSSEQKN